MSLLELITVLRGEGKRGQSRKVCVGEIPKSLWFLRIHRPWPKEGEIAFVLFVE